MQWFSAMWLRLSAWQSRREGNTLALAFECNSMAWRSKIGDWRRSFEWFRSKSGNKIGQIRIRSAMKMLANITIWPRRQRFSFARRRGLRRSFSTSTSTSTSVQSSTPPAFFLAKSVRVLASRSFIFGWFSWSQKHP